MQSIFVILEIDGFNEVAICGTFLSLELAKEHANSGEWIEEWRGSEFVQKHLA